MDNKQKPEKEQLQQPASSKVREQGESIQNETQDLPPKHSAPNESSGIGELFQDGAKLFQDGFKRITENFGRGSQQQMKPEKIDIVKHNIQNVYNLLCRFEKGNERSLTPGTIDNVRHDLNRVLESYSILQQDNETLRSNNTCLYQENQILNQNCSSYYQQYNHQSQAHSRLRQEYETLISSNAVLQEDKQRLTKQCNEIVDRCNALARQSQANYQLQQKYETLINSNTALQDEIKQLKQERDAFKKERDQLASDRGCILSELAEKNRDKTTTYVGSDLRPQHHLLFQEFKQLKEQQFHAVSSDIFRYRCESEPSLKANRKQEIANIKSILSKEIIIEGLHLFIGNSEFPADTVANAVKVVSHSIRSALGIPEEAEITEALSNELDSLLKKGMKLANGKNSTNTHEGSWTEEDFTKAIKNINNSIYSTLGIPEEDRIPEALRNDLENLVGKGLELVKKIASADPPGVLWTEKKGTPFKFDRHEAMLGCEEGGKILLTIYPGYLVGDRVFEKALVFTVPEEEAESADNKSEHKDEIQGT